MKKHTFCLYVVCLIFAGVLKLNGQDTTAAKKDSVKIWKKGGAFNINIAQVGLKNWVGGGQNSFSVTALQNLYLNLDKPHLKWTNSLDLGFGLLRQGPDTKFYKSEDKIIFISKVSRDFTKGWYFTGLADFRTQLAPGHEFKKDSTGEQHRKLISRFLAPAYLIVSPGIEYKLKDYLYAFISPVTGKFTFVNDNALAARGAFGVEPGNRFRKEFGAYFNAGLKKKVVENVSVDTRIGLFSNYETFGNIDVNWEFTLFMKVNKYITTTLSTQLLYDEDIDVKKDDGTTGAAVQFKEVINIGFLYQFGK
jgi:hypothetical protein